MTTPWEPVADRLSRLLTLTLQHPFRVSVGIRRRGQNEDGGESTRCSKGGVEGLDLGGSSAQSVILMLIVIALTVLQFRYIERRVQYQ